MIPILYGKDETAFASGGLGRLTDALRCEVSETLNGAYELVLEYPADGLHGSDLAEDRIVLAAHDDTGRAQPFRVYKVTGTMDGRVTALARHISYDLSRVTVLPYEAATASAAMAGLSAHAVTACPYTFVTDSAASGAFSLDAPVSIRAALGAEGNVSILGTYGGEIEWDRLTVRHTARRGADNGVTIRYGKNLRTLEQTTEGGTYTAIVPYYRNNEGVTVYASGYVVSTGAYTDAPPVDVTDRFDYVPTAAQVAEAGLAWLAEQRPFVTPRSLTLSFAALWQTEEYRDYAPIQRVVLGDTVGVMYRIAHTALGVDDKLRVVRTVYDVLNERYTDITLGELTQSVGSVLRDLEQRLTRQIDAAKQIVSQIANGTYTGGTFINGDLIYSPNIYGGASLHIGANEDVDEGYNFNVDSSGDLVSYGDITLKGDTEIYAGKYIGGALYNEPEGTATLGQTWLMIGRGPNGESSQMYGLSLYNEGYEGGSKPYFILRRTLNVIGLFAGTFPFLAVSTSGWVKPNLTWDFAGKLAGAAPATVTLPYVTDPADLPDPTDLYDGTIYLVIDSTTGTVTLRAVYGSTWI